MQITSVERLLVDVPFFEIPERNMARQHAGWHISEVCRVRTDTGLVGYGETMPNYTWGRVTDAAVARVQGKAPAECMWDDGLGAGLQMALFDLVGKAQGVPAYRLLGDKVRDWCPLSWWSVDMPPEDMAAEAQQAAAAGYTAHKQKARPWFDVVEQTRRTSAVVPPTFSLDLDFNGHLGTAAAAVSVLKELDAFANVKIYETPIPQGDVAGNQRIRSQTRCAIAMHYGSPPIMTALREQVCDGFVVGGGAAAVRRQAAVAQEANLPFWLQLVGTGITTAFAMHQGAVSSHAQWPAVTCLNMYRHQLLKAPLTVQGGYVRVPEAPGLGVGLTRIRWRRSPRRPACVLRCLESMPCGAGMVRLPTSRASDSIARACHVVFGKTQRWGTCRPMNRAHGWTCWLTTAPPSGATSWRGFNWRQSVATAGNQPGASPASPARCRSTAEWLIGLDSPCSLC
jgi:L-alanine-DL-glutamate epimerase-like enolase superfamily enzyme